MVRKKWGALAGKKWVNNRRGWGGGTKGGWRAVLSTAKARRGRTKKRKGLGQGKGGKSPGIGTGGNANMGVNTHESNL